MRSSLHDRLKRLHGSPRPVTPASLEQVEREVLGQDLLPSRDEILSLKQRLERLVAAASAKDRGRERRREAGALPLEELVDGLRLENDRGEFFRVDSEVHLEARHGDLPLSRVELIEAGSVAVLAGDPAMASFDLRRAVFLDTETTGLAGGTGTAAFLVGLGRFDGSRFRVRQLFMRDYHEEGALLRGLAEELRGCDRLVTFNGRQFDVPLLEARFRLNRDRFPLGELPHLDLLHPSRRLWKARLESCRLQSLEAELLGLRRRGDIPGEQIPQVYFDWVRRRDARLLARVFEHNRQDIVSLAALAVFACRWVEEDCAEDPRDLLSLARVLERAGRTERSEQQYRRAVELGTGRLRGSALLRLAWSARRRGETQRALALLRQAGEAGEPEAWRALAVQLEHRAGDLEGALEAVDRGLRLLESERLRERAAFRAAEAFDRRRQRLLRKLGTA